MKHKNDKIEIGQKLKNARLSCGLTQEQVCEKIECASRYIGQIETNQTVGSISTILKLCSLYGITLNDIYADYLPKNPISNNTSLLAGYFKLNDNNRAIIDNMLNFLNKQQNKNN